MVKFLRAALLIALCNLHASRADSQEIRAAAKVDSNRIQIGDWIRLTLEVEHPKDVSVTLPPFPDSVEYFELVRAEPPIVKESEGVFLRTQEFILTSFDSGLHVIPPIPVPYRRGGDTAGYYVRTPAIPVVVGGVSIDTTLDIKDVKPPLSVPLRFSDFIPYLAVFVAVAGLVWIVRYVMKKRRKGEPLIPDAPPRPPHEVALEALKSLESEKLWQRGKVKDYHSELTDIIRVYIERLFRIPAMESTSDEVLSAFSDGLISRDAREGLETILFRADLVKFAKLLPAADENETSLRLAYSFIEATRRGEPAQKAEKHMDGTDG